MRDMEQPMLEGSGPFKAVFVAQYPDKYLMHQIFTEVLIPGSYPVEIGIKRQLVAFIQNPQFCQIPIHYLEHNQIVIHRPIGLAAPCSRHFLK